MRNTLTGMLNTFTEEQQLGTEGRYAVANEAANQTVVELYYIRVAYYSGRLITLVPYCLDLHNNTCLNCRHTIK